MSKLTPVVTIYGYATAEGNVANLTDHDDATFWAPYADGFDSYTVPPIADSGFVLPGYPRPAIQFDFAESVRIPMFLVKTQTLGALGPCWLLASANTATSVDDTVQTTDVFAGYFTKEQMNSNVAITTDAAIKPIRARFWRFVSFKNPPAA